MRSWFIHRRKMCPNLTKSRTLIKQRLQSDILDGVFGLIEALRKWLRENCRRTTFDKASKRELRNKFPLLFETLIVRVDHVVTLGFFKSQPRLRVLSQRT